MQRDVRAAGVVALLLVAVVPLAAVERVWFVPWKVLDASAAPASGVFVLYWIPASPEDLKRSDLVTSRALAVYSARCVAMHVVRVDDTDRLNALVVTELPVAVLADGHRQLARLNGPLRVGDVEAMVGAEFDAREVEANEMRDAARECLRNGDAAEAKRLFREVARQRCSFPRQAKAAARALRRLK